MSNKEEIIKEVITILGASSYIDSAEHVYDGLKQLKRGMTYSTVHDFLWALESSTVTDVDGRVAECARKIKPLLADMTIDEVYENYITQTRIEFKKWCERNPDTLVDYREDTKELFLKSIKEDKHWFTGEKGFSEKWGLKIEERELSLEERTKILVSQSDNKRDFYDRNHKLIIEEKSVLDASNIPAKLITITYNNETIDIYE
jgi:hypothetical protein